MRNTLSRRDALKPALMLTLASALSVSQDAVAAPTSNVLVAYFTRTGNTRVIANQIRRARKADLFEIEPAEAYPEDYEATVRQAEQQRLRTST